MKIYNCPFCNSEAFIKRRMDDHRYNELPWYAETFCYFYIECGNCQVRTKKHFSAKEAIDLWNRRD